MRLAFRAFLALSAFALLTACGKRDASSGPSPSAKGGISTAHTLHIGNAAEPADLDPHLAAVLNDQIVTTALFEGLTVLDERTTAPLPAAAESWTTSPDGLTWTFRLREGLKWSDGSPLVADDFVQSWGRVLSPTFAADNAWYLFALKGAESFNAKKAPASALGLSAPDPRTLILTLERPTPYLAALVSMPAWFPVPPRVLEKHGGLEKRGSAWTRPGNLVGNGPFTLTEWRPNARIVVTKNPHHRDAARNRLDSLVFYPVENPDVEERMFRAGQLHVTFNLPVTKIAGWRQQAPDQLRIDPVSQINFLRFNTQKAPLTDIRVRRALSLAIDRAAIAKAVLQGSRAPATALTPPGTGGYTAQAAIGTSFDEARRLLAEAGFPGGKGLPVLDLQCRNDEIMPRLAEALQAMWLKELGLRITISQLEQKTWVQNMQSLNYTISTAAWTADFPDPVTFLGMFTANSAYNWTGWKHDDYEKLMDTAGATPDATRRYDLFQQAEKLLLDQSPISPLYVGAQTYLIHPSVKNWHPSPLVFRRYQEVYLDPK